MSSAVGDVDVLHPCVSESWCCRDVAVAYICREQLLVGLDRSSSLHYHYFLSQPLEMLKRATRIAQRALVRGESVPYMNVLSAISINLLATVCDIARNGD